MGEIVDLGIGFEPVDVDSDLPAKKVTGINDDFSKVFIEELAKKIIRYAKKQIETEGSKPKEMAWDPLRRNTLEIKEQRGYGDKGMLEESGRLKDSLDWRWEGDDTILVGCINDPPIYAGIQEYGTIESPWTIRVTDDMQGYLKETYNVRPPREPYLRIPARPFFRPAVEYVQRDPEMLDAELKASIRTGGPYE